MGTEPEAKDIPTYTAVQWASGQREAAHDENTTLETIGTFTTLIREALRGERKVDFRVYDSSPLMTRVALATQPMEDDSFYMEVCLKRTEAVLSSIEIGAMDLEDIKFLLVRANLPLMRAQNLFRPGFAEAAINLSFAVRR